MHITLTHTHKYVVKQNHYDTSPEHQLPPHLPFFNLVLPSSIYHSVARPTDSLTPRPTRILRHSPLRLVVVPEQVLVARTLSGSHAHVAGDGPREDKEIDHDHHCMVMQTLLLVVLMGGIRILQPGLVCVNREGPELTVSSRSSTSRRCGAVCVFPEARALACSLRSSHCP